MPSRNRTFDESQEFDELETDAASLARTSHWAELQRTETLKRLESIVVTVQPMHKSDSMTLMHSGDFDGQFGS